MTKVLVEILCFVFMYLSKVLVFGKSSQLFVFSFLIWYMVFKPTYWVVLKIIEEPRTIIPF